MQKRIYFAIATAIVALTMDFWVKASVMESNDAQLKFELSSPIINP